MSLQEFRIDRILDESYGPVAKCRIEPAGGLPGEPGPRFLGIEFQVVGLGPDYGMRVVRFNSHDRVGQAMSDVCGPDAVLAGKCAILVTQRDVPCRSRLAGADLGCDRRAACGR